VQLARALASENRVAREKLMGTIRGVGLNFASIITHNGKKFEITEGSWDVYEEVWNVTLIEILAWSTETITFTTENENTSRETTINSDGAITGVGVGNVSGFTSTEILTRVKEVDGTGSGLDADLLDGQHGSYYAPVASPTFNGKVENQVPHTFNADDEIRIGSYYEGNFYGIGFYYWVDEGGSPHSYISHYNGGARTDIITVTDTGIVIGGNVKATALKTANWSIEEDGTSLIIKRGTTVLAKITSAGIIEAASNIKGRVTL
jgi:hypothetical protein